MVDFGAILKTLPHDMSIKEKEEYPTLEDAVNHINNIDFSPLYNKLSKKDPNVSRVWLKEDIDIAVQYYKNFLYLNKKYIGKIPLIVPSIEVDEIWHHHILDTRSYIKDCNAIFGYYFHHYPYFGIRGEDDFDNLNKCFEFTLDIYEIEFGCRMKQICP